MGADERDGHYAVYNRPRGTHPTSTRRDPSPPTADHTHRLTAYLQMMPAFDERRPLDFFRSFERTARVQRIPDDLLAPILFRALVGDGRTAANRLSDAESNDYDQLKKAVLTAYRACTATLQRTFRETRKRSDQTFEQFARDKERDLEAWLHAAECDSLEDLKQIILKEELANHLPREHRINVEMRRLPTVIEAARVADAFDQAAKRPQTSPPETTRTLATPRPWQDRQTPRAPTAPTPRQNQPFCDYHGRPGHWTRECRAKERSRRQPTQGNRAVQGMETLRYGDTYGNPCTCQHTAQMQTRPTVQPPLSFQTDASVPPQRPTSYMD